MSEETQYHIQRLAALRQERGNFDSQWEQAASLVLPSDRNAFTGRAAIGRVQGEKKSELQYDSTAMLGAMRFSSVMESLTIPQSSIWHLLRAVDPTLRKNRQVRVFFDELSEVLFNYRYRASANFVGNSQQTLLSLGVYGNGTLFIDKPDKQRGLRYKFVHLGECYYVQNHAGVVDTIYRVPKLSPRQIVKEYSEGVPEAIRKAAENPNMADKEDREVLICVYPRDDYGVGRLDAKGMPFASVHILVESQTVVRESGYATFPFAIARYTQAPGELYGRGPAQWALPTIKVLNEEKKQVLKQGHRILDPVLLAHDDGNLGAFSLKAGALNPGGVSAEGRALIQPLPTGNIAVGYQMMDQEKAVINDVFLITLFQILIDTPQMTATEVLERAREKGMLLAPTAGRLQAEFLGPMIEREIDVLGRQGLLPRMPAILRDIAAEYRIEYDSPMSRMQRSEKAAGFLRALSQAAEYAKATGDIEPLDYFNFDVATPQIIDIAGAPTSWTRSDEEVQARRAERSKAAQTQQMIDGAPAMASVMKTAKG